MIILFKIIKWNNILLILLVNSQNSVLRHNMFVYVKIVDLYTNQCVLIDYAGPQHGGLWLVDACCSVVDFGWLMLTIRY